MKRRAADEPSANGRSPMRQRYIVKAVLAYAVFSLIWIYFSDLLLAALVDVTKMHWLSTAKGILYVLVTALMLFLMMRAVPGEGPGRIHASLVGAALVSNGMLHRFMYVFAVLVSLAMLVVRSQIAVSASDRPMLILFMLPVILSAVVGGLGPGLVATAVSALGLCFTALPPAGHFSITHAHDIFQLLFFVGNGVLVSLLSHVLHRLRRQSEAEKQQHQVTLESIGDGVIATDIHGRVAFLNSEAARIIGWGRGEALGRPLAEVLRIFEGDSLPEAYGGEGYAMAAGGEGVADRLMMLRSRDGMVVPINQTRAKIRREDGTLLGEVLVIRDDTARRQAEAVLRESERALLDESERRRVLTDNSRDGIVIIDQEYRVYEANRRFMELLGYAADEVGGLFVRDFDDLFDTQPIWNDVADLASAGMTFETRFRRQDGATFPVEVSVSATKWAGQQLVFCVCRDISERKQAEEETRKLEQQLVQAQKMEAVGRLAGGVAHDFNNMLSVIIGHAEIVLNQLHPQDPVREDLQEILNAADRSAGLTRQLLAFARKQTVSPRILDLNETVASMLKMLRRLIGEDIDLLWSPGHDLWPVKIDPSQIDQMLANLAVNARDAIGGVGRLTIATANITFIREGSQKGQTIPPGDYVMLTVGDTGPGMSEEVIEHIFEPFYTTKEIGKGTGLGLSMVFGIVKQNSGFVEVQSSAHAGTVFRIYLPRCGAGSMEPAPEGNEAVQPPRGDETVLIVEDEPAILRLGATMLRRQGYTVLTAATPSEAIAALLAQKDAIQLLITDVVMPEMNGRNLVERLRAMKPGLKCLYMSGYTADAIAHHGVLDEGVRFLQKPFTMLELATQVRRALDDEG